MNKSCSFLIGKQILAIANINCAESVPRSVESFVLQNGIGVELVRLDHVNGIYQHMKRQNGFKAITSDQNRMKGFINIIGVTLLSKADCV